MIITNKTSPFGVKGIDVNGPFTACPVLNLSRQTNTLVAKTCRHRQSVSTSGVATAPSATVVAYRTSYTFDYPSLSTFDVTSVNVPFMLEDGQRYVDVLIRAIGRRTPGAAIAMAVYGLHSGALIGQTYRKEASYDDKGYEYQEDSDDTTHSAILTLDMDGAALTDGMAYVVPLIGVEPSGTGIGATSISTKYFYLAEVSIETRNDTGAYG